MSSFFSKYFDRDFETISSMNKTNEIFFKTRATIEMSIISSNNCEKKSKNLKNIKISLKIIIINFNNNIMI